MWKRILAVLGLLILGAAAAAFGFLYLRKPAMAPPADVKVEMTPERIERGRYLFVQIADCDGCHSERDMTRFGGPVVESRRGAGNVFPVELGLPGAVTASNITPDRETGVGAWTDGEKIRAIREGISRDGRVLFPMMPYGNFRKMSDEDVHALVAYMNTLPAVRNPLPATKIDFPVNLMIKSAPQPAGSVPKATNHGEYLVTIGGCADCHTQQERGAPVAGMRFAGGRVFKMPAGTVVSANITPDAETGIGKWTEQQFLDKFYQYKEYAQKGSPQVGPEGFTLMPWLPMSQLPPADLTAILGYLKTQPAVHNAVETHPGYSKSANSQDRSILSRLCNCPNPPAPHPSRDSMERFFEPLPVETSRLKRRLQADSPPYGFPAPTPQQN